MFFKNQNGLISPWHSIPLHSQNKNLFNFVSEIPSGTKRKIEMNKNEENNPLSQDTVTSEGGQRSLREFKYGSLPFNYGFFPQTFESDTVRDALTGLKGDGDPIDVVELSASPIETGEVHPVKLLGAICLIDQDETDWKILSISQNSPFFHQISSVEEVREKMPRAVDVILDWFINYKVAEGKKRNTIFSHGHEDVFDKAKALEIIQNSHRTWELAKK